MYAVHGTYLPKTPTYIWYSTRVLPLSVEFPGYVRQSIDFCLPTVLNVLQVLGLIASIPHAAPSVPPRTTADARSAPPIPYSDSPAPHAVSTILQIVLEFLPKVIEF
ncbi:hypothetical protein D3C81_1639830 [compost metagenome]